MSRTTGAASVHITGITLFPVKSLRGCARQSAVVEPWGLAGDRRYMVVDGDGRFLSQRECPAMATLDAETVDDGVVLKAVDGSGIVIAAPGPDAAPIAVSVWKDDVRARAAGDAADAWLTAALGRPCRLAFMDDPEHARAADPAFASEADRVSFADGYPLLVTSTASLDDLNGRLPAPIGMERFRANIIVDGAVPWAEDGWRHLRIGSASFDVVKPCARCIMVTTDQRTGTRDPAHEPIRTLQRFRRDAKGQVIFGQNLVPRSGGTIAVGDDVEARA
jgi:uncharacterized protein